MLKTGIVALTLVMLLAVTASALEIEGEKSQTAAWGRNYVLADGWIYYQVRANDAVIFYRMKEDGSGAEQIAGKGGALHMGVSGNSIYYSMPEDALYRMNLDGANVERLVEEEWDCLAFDGTYFFLSGTYSYASKRNSGIFRLDLGKDKWNQSDMKRLSSDMVSGFEDLFVEDGWIYYHSDNYLKNKNRTHVSTINRMRTDGSKHKELLSTKKDWHELLAVQNGRVYYNQFVDETERYSLRSMNADGSDQRTILDGAEGLCADKDYIYFKRDGESGLYSVSMESGEVSPKIADITSSSDCQEAGQWLFFKDKELIMLKKDGSERKVVPGFEPLVLDDEDP